ncbi:MFS transporter [Rhodococcus aerolatus]
MTRAAPPAAPTAAGLAAARRGVAVAFVLAGFAFASWAAQIPQVRENLGLSPAALGLLLLAMAAGSLAAPPLAGAVVLRLGAARTVAVASVVLAASLVGAGTGQLVGPAPVAVALFVMGFSHGTWDVAMNVAAAATEQQLGRTLMPRFHAGFSLGTVLGAVSTAGVVAAGVPVVVHLVLVGVVVAVVVPPGSRGFLPEPPAAEGAPGGRTAVLRAWREPRTLLVGVFVLCLAFTEGTGNDWLAVAVIDGYGASPTQGSLTFAVFVTAMTTGRWFGTSVVDRWGRVPVLRASAALALAGLLVVVLGGGLVVAVLGAVLWGLGASLGFPVGMSAAADDPARAAARVSVVASIAYTAFLAGPPLIGLLGEHVGVLRALSVVAGLLVVAVLVSGALRPLPAAQPAAGPAAGPPAQPPAEPTGSAGAGRR